MGSLPPAQACALTAAPSAPRLPDRMVRWAYIDAGKTHELHVGIAKGPPLVFFVRERGLRRDEVDAWHETCVPMSEVWESKLHHAAFEQRLSVLGSYYRHNVGQQGWHGVGRASAARTLDLQPLAFRGIPPTPRFHAYGHRDDDRFVLLMATRLDAADQWHHLARLDFRFPDPTDGHLTPIASRVPTVVLHSLLAREHLELAKLGMEKITSVNREEPANEPWCAQMERCLQQALAGVRAGRYKVAAPAQADRPAAGGHAQPRGAKPAYTLEHADPTRRRPALQEVPPLSPQKPSYEIEDADPARARKEVKQPALCIEDVTVTYLEALRNPRLLALHARYLSPEKEQLLMEGGEMAIRAFIKELRDQVNPDHQHLVSILEASLLARYAFSRGRGANLDPQAGQLLRRSLVYL